MFKSKDNPITLFAVLLILFIVQPFVQINFQSPNLFYLVVFVICSTLFFMIMQNVSWGVLDNDKEIRQIKSLLYDTMEVAKPNYPQIKEIITKERNQRICKGIQHILMSDKHTRRYINLDVIKSNMENGTIHDIANEKSFSRENKRYFRRYVKIFNDNTDDLEEIKRDFETKDLLRSKTDVKSIVGLILTIIFGILSLISLNAFLDFLHTRIINIIIMLIVDTVYIIEEYYKHKKYLLKHYSDLNDEIKDAITQIHQEHKEENTDEQTKNALPQQS